MKQKLYQLVWWWGPVVVWCAIIFVMSHTPNLSLSQGPSDYALRKTAHMAVYGLLFLLSYRAISKSLYEFWSTNTVILAALISLAYGVSDEVHQYYVPTRSGLWTDIVFDAAGIALALTALAWWTWWQRTLREVEVGGEGRSDSRKQEQDSKAGSE